MRSVTDAPSVGVVICAYTMKRWDDVVAAYRSTCAQEPAVAEIVLVIDHNTELLGALRREFPTACIVPNMDVRGLSGARNTGVAALRTDVVLFLDDDAYAAPDWASRLAAHFAEPFVQGVAGHATPNWDRPGAPGWFPDEFLWVVGCSYRGLPEVIAQVRNPIGSTMGFRRDLIERIGGFSSSVGRVGTHPVGCEETEFSIRMRQLDPQARIVLDPSATVFHRVTGDRRRLAYFARRCYWEGVSKAVVARIVGREDALASERRYVSAVLPRAVMRGLLRTVKGDLDGVRTSAAVVLGLGLTMAGFLRGRLAGAATGVPTAQVVLEEAA